MLLGRITLKPSGNYVRNVLNCLRVVGHDLEMIHRVFLGQTTYLWMIQDIHFRLYIAQIWSDDLETFRKMV